MTKKVYYTNKMIQKGVLGIARQMMFDKWVPEYIVGINRGGLLPSVLLSHFLNINHYTLDVRLRDGPDNVEHFGPEHNTWMMEDATNGKNILIVDDINDSGATFQWIKDDWDCDEKFGDNIRTMAIVNNLSSKFEVDYSHYEINKAEDDVWIVFPYENWWE